MKNHFELFGLVPSYALEAEALDRSYREIQALIHPDRYANSGDAERRASMQWATRVNEAYRTLKNPVQRAKYLLELNGVDVAFETNTAMPPDFLMRQMELREALEAAIGRKDGASLDSLRKNLSREKESLEGQIGDHIDVKRDYLGAAQLARKLMFLEKLGAEIDSAFEAVES